MIPALAISGANAYWLWTEHWEHWSHLPPLPERAEYPYQNIRTKNFQWGDGDKVSQHSVSYSTDCMLTSIIDSLVSSAGLYLNRAFASYVQQSTFTLQGARIVC